MGRAVVLSAVRHRGVVVATRPDYAESAFVPAADFGAKAPRDTEFLAADEGDRAAPTMVYTDGVLNLCSSHPYFVAAAGGLREHEELRPLFDCVTVHGRAGVEGTLDFGARAAQAHLGRLSVYVHPQPPLGEGAFERMLSDVTQAASQLLFDCAGPTSVGVARERQREREALYPLFRFIRHAMLEAPPHERLGSCFDRVAHAPHHRTFRQREATDVSAARDAGPTSLRDLAARPSSLALLAERSPLRESPLGRLLGAHGRAYFPQEVFVERVRQTYDTPENRFVRHLLGLLQEALERAGAAFAEHGALTRDFVARANRLEAERLAGEVRRLRRAEFLRDVGDLQVFPGQSQVLMKREGYRELTRLYHLLFLAGQVSWDDLAQIENRRIDVLYEYWVFFQLVEVVQRLAQALRRPRVAQLSSAAEGLLLDLGRRGHVSLDVVPKASLGLEPCRLTFARALEPGRESWSVELRPSVTLETASGRRLAVEVSCEGTWTPEGPAAATARQERLLTRLHGLRDAAGVGCSLHLTPGGEPQFFTRGGSFPGFHACRRADVEGVGLVPLAPGSKTDAVRLERLVSAFLGA